MLILYMTLITATCTVEKPVCTKPPITRVHPKPWCPIPKPCDIVS